MRKTDEALVGTTDEDRKCPGGGTIPIGAVGDVGIGIEARVLRLRDWDQQAFGKGILSELNAPRSKLRGIVPVRNLSILDALAGPVHGGCRRPRRNCRKTVIFPSNGLIAEPGL
jgi:hypothetical protein